MDASQLRENRKEHTAKQDWEQGSHIDDVTYQLLNERQFKILQVLSLLADEFHSEWKRSRVFKIPHPLCFPTP